MKQTELAIEKIVDTIAMLGQEVALLKDYFRENSGDNWLDVFLSNIEEIEDLLTPKD